VDPVDLKIVQQLDRNCRDSFAFIGGVVGVPARTVQRRVAKMVRNGFIRSFEVVVDPASLDLGEAVCDIQVTADAKKEEVRNRLLKIPNVTEVISLAGGSFVVYLVYRDSGDLESVLSRMSATAGVADVQYELNPRTGERSSRLSRQSWALIHALNHQARRESADIAAEVGLSARTVQRNIKWLSDTAAVRFGVDVDLSKAQDLFIYVLVVRLQLGTPKLKILEQVRNSVASVWRELRTVNPHTLILVLYADRTAELERDVETVRLVHGVAGVRILIITGDRRNSQLIDSKFAERAGK
jgi:Lrp/AsnC family transcriptional regulator, leucine-responsive regulatory protein